MKQKIIEFRKGDKKKFKSAEFDYFAESPDLDIRRTHSKGGPISIVITDNARSEFYVQHIISVSQGDAEILIYDSGSF